MKIVDINGKKRKIKSIKKILHDIQDIEGHTIKEPYVEVEIKGKQSTWLEWYPLSDFEEKNPGVTI